MTAVLDFGTGFTEVVRTVIRQELGSGGEHRDASSHWPTRLWEVHRDTRLSVEEAAAALGRSKSWVYAKVRAGQLPAIEFDGELRFVAGQLRDWLRQREVVKVAPPKMS